MKNNLKFFERNNLDEVVFQNRNKSYGAYALRSDYSSNLTKSLFIGIGVFVAISIVPLVLSQFSRVDFVEVPSTPVIPYVMDNVDKPDKPLPTQSVQADVKTVNSIVPNPTRNMVVDQPLPNKKELDNAAIGLITKDGEETNVVVSPPIVSGPATSLPTGNVPMDLPLDPKKVFSSSEADVSASFKGGIEAFRQRVLYSFDTDAVADESLVSALITFIVEKDGSITNIKVAGDNPAFNKEAERTIKSIRTKWTAAKYKGESVRSSFRMPISMKID